MWPLQAAQQTKLVPATSFTDILTCRVTLCTDDQSRSRQTHGIPFHSSRTDGMLGSRSHCTNLAMTMHTPTWSSVVSTPVVPKALSCSLLTQYHKTVTLSYTSLTQQCCRTDLSLRLTPRKVHSLVSSALNPRAASSRAQALPSSIQPSSIDDHLTSPSSSQQRIIRTGCAAQWLLLLLDLQTHNMLLGLRVSQGLHLVTLARSLLSVHVRRCIWHAANEVTGT